MPGLVAVTVTEPVCGSSAAVAAVLSDSGCTVLICTGSADALTTLRAGSACAAEPITARVYTG